MHQLPTTVHYMISAAPFTMQIDMISSACPTFLFKIQRYRNLSTFSKVYQMLPPNEQCNTPLFNNGSLRQANIVVAQAGGRKQIWQEGNPKHEQEILTDRGLVKNTFFAKYVDAICIMYRLTREISLQGEGARLLVQLSNSFSISCFEKHYFFIFLFQQLSFKLIDSCTSSSAPFPCIETIRQL